MIDKLPELRKKIELYWQRQPELVQLVSRWNQPGTQGHRLFSLARAFRMKAVATRFTLWRQSSIARLARSPL